MWKDVSNAGKFWRVVLIIVFILCNIYCVPYVIKVEGRHMVDINMFIAVIGTLTMIIDGIILLILGVCGIVSGIESFNNFLNGLKFEKKEKKPKPKKVQFKTIEEFKNN